MRHRFLLESPLKASPPCDPSVVSQPFSGLAGAILSGAGNDQAADHAAAQGTHLVVDRKVNAGPEPRVPGLVSTRGEIGFVCWEEVAQDRRRRCRNRRVA